MLKCQDCKIILDKDVRFCPKCGRSITSAQDGRGIPNVEVGALLTSANLHRIRGEWDDAIVDATEALKADPDNSDIASLLGSIYEQRGMLNDAAAWYQMAVELDPGSSPDKARLERVKEHLHREKTDSFLKFQKHAKLWAGLLAGVFMLAVVLALLTMLRGGGDHRQSSDTQPKQQQTPPVVHGTSNPPTRPPAGGPAQKTHRAAPKSAESPSLRTPGEVYVKSRTVESPAVQQAGAVVNDIVADPRESIVVVTFSVPTKPSVTKSRVVRAAVEIARAVFAANREARFVTARCVIAGDDPVTTQIAFVGDVARESIDSLPAQPADEQLEALFTRPWWNPQVK